MRRLLFVVLAVTICAACTQSYVDDSTAMMSTDIPETINVSLEDDTRVQLDANGKTVWTAGDELTAFYRSDANSRFTFRGNTGDRNGGFTIAEQGDKTMDIDEVILLYPYSEEYKLDAENRCVDVKIPATQRYEDGSYGVGANLMASVETGDNFTLKSLCGWIAVQFKGAGKVMSVTLTGNNNEQLAGDAQLNYDTLDLELLYYPGAPDDDTQVGGSLIFGDYQQTITLDCGDGVELHYTEPTEFYFVVAPQTFANGITIEATCSDGTILTKSSSNALTVERNHIVPMSPLTVMEDIPDNQIWYISTDGNIVEPNNKTAFGATLISNVYKNGKGVMTFEGAVTEIGAEAFERCSTLSNITIPDSVTEIGNYAFISCDSLESVTIPDSVNSIGYCTFYMCDSLESVTIPDSVTSIGEWAFRDCRSLASVTIPYSVTSIGDSAFYDCSSLTSVTIPDSVTSIGQEAFSGCTSLTSFYGKFASEDNRCLIVDGKLIAFAPVGLTEYTIPDSVTSIGMQAFSSCDSLTSITIPDSVTEIGNYAFENCTSLTSVTIPDSVTEIGNYAFEVCDSLTSVTIGNGVTEIGDGAFVDCTSLTSVTIGNGVTSIGNYAFSGCTLLTSVTIPDSVTSIGSFAFYYCTSLTSFYGKFASEDNRCLIVDGKLIAFAPVGLTEYTIPDSVTSIGDAAFSGCDSLTSVTIPDSVTSIGEAAFDGCTSLTSVTIPDSVTSIGEGAFAVCSSLTSITIPDSVTSIGNSAFLYCSSLTSVTIPDSVTSIGEAAFRDCDSLTSVYCKPATPPSLGEYAFKRFDDGGWNLVNIGCTIYVPTASVEAYKSAEYWSDYASDIVDYEF